VVVVSLCLSLWLGACGFSGSGPPQPAGPGGVPATGADVGDPGDIPDTQAFIAYRPPGGGWMVNVPEGWARVDRTGGARFSDRFHAVAVEATLRPTAPVAEVVHAEPAVTRDGGQRVAELAVSSADRAAGRAVLGTWTADSEPNPVTTRVVRLAYERYLFWRDGIQVAITLSGPVGADDVDPWRTVTDSFRWEP
jgi:hypothetical protein